MGSGFAKKKKQAKMLEQQFLSMRDELKKTEVVGSAGNGLVTIVIDGENKMKSIKIKPDCVDKDDIEGLEVLIKAAHEDALAKLEAQSAQGMPSGMPNLSNFGF